MGLLDWLKNILGGKKTINKSDLLRNLGIDYTYKKIAIDTCISFIARSITLCEVQTFEKGKRVRKSNYYSFNVRPNKNDNAKKFMNKLVSKLIYENECLVVMIDDEYYIADSFVREQEGLKEARYKDIVVNEKDISGNYYESQVLYLKYEDEGITEVINELYASLGKLIAASMNYYQRKNNKRILIKGDFFRAQDDETQEAIDKLFEEQLENWFNPNIEGSVFQLQEGYEIQDLSDGQTASTGNSALSRDLADLINDVFNYVAMRFHIPRGILKGDLANVEIQTETMITFAIKPISDLIQAEINAKVYEKEDFLARTYAKIDTSKININDFTKIAAALDKLFAIGGYSINDVLEELGKEPKDEEWAKKHYVTKNYERAELKGSGENEE